MDYERREGGSQVTPAEAPAHPYQTAFIHDDDVDDDDEDEDDDDDDDDDDEDLHRVTAVSDSDDWDSNDNLKKIFGDVFDDEDDDRNYH